MTRRIKRRPQFDVQLTIKDDDFIRPPRDAQRNWLLNAAVAEFVADLEALDRLAADFVPGLPFTLPGDRSQAELTDEQIMEDWQVPLMRAMADLVTVNGGEVLEVGFGRGISSQFIQEAGVTSHTIIECNESIIRRLEDWTAEWPDRDIRIVPGRWQDVLSGLGTFDGIFFHTYPLTDAEFLDQIGDTVTFAEHFFEHAGSHLRGGGIFTYLANEIDSLSRAHQRALFKHFRSIEITVMSDLPVPKDVRDAWWSRSMAVVRAVR